MCYFGSGTAEKSTAPTRRLCISGFKRGECAGIGYSDDKLLQTRIFSYADTQRHRLGPNYLMLPANAPKCAHHNNHHDGFMNFMHRDEEARPRVRIRIRDSYVSSSGTLLTSSHLSSLCNAPCIADGEWPSACLPV